MKRIAILLLLLAFSASWAVPAGAQRRDMAESARFSRKMAKKQQKLDRKTAKMQQNAIKKNEKAQRKAAKKAAKNANHRS